MGGQAKIECMVLVALPKWPINQFSKADNRLYEFTVLIYVLCFKMNITKLLPAWVKSFETKLAYSQVVVPHL